MHLDHRRASPYPMPQTSVESMIAPAPLSDGGAVALPDRAKLGPTVAADLKALQADLEEAKRLAAEHEAQLVGKNTELERMTELFEKTRRHLIQLQLSVTNLRDERHRLANRAMECDALQRKLTLVSVERDRLQEQVIERQRWQG